MISKFLVRNVMRSLAIRARPMQYPVKVFLPVKTLLPQMITYRAGHILPKTQYDTPWPKKMTLAGAMRNWEVLPLFAIVGACLSWLCFSIYWACFNKVDVVFNRSHCPSTNLSHTMDLMMPTTHKLFIIHQKYKPYPEMYCIQAKMKRAANNNNKSKCKDK